MLEDQDNLPLLTTFFTLLPQQTSESLHHERDTLRMASVCLRKDFKDTHRWLCSADNEIDSLWGCISNLKHGHSSHCCKLSRHGSLSQSPSHSCQCHASSRASYSLYYSASPMMEDWDISNAHPAHAPSDLLMHLDMHPSSTSTTTSFPIAPGAGLVLQIADASGLAPIMPGVDLGHWLFQKLGHPFRGSYFLRPDVQSFFAACVSGSILTPHSHACHPHTAAALWQLLSEMAIAPVMISTTLSPLLAELPSPSRTAFFPLACSDLTSCLADVMTSTVSFMPTIPAPAPTTLFAQALDFHSMLPVLRSVIPDIRGNINPHAHKHYILAMGRLGIGQPAWSTTPTWCECLISNAAVRCCMAHIAFPLSSNFKGGRDGMLILPGKVPTTKAVIHGTMDDKVICLCRVNGNIEHDVGATTNVTCNQVDKFDAAHMCEDIDSMCQNSHAMDVRVIHLHRVNGNIGHNDDLQDQVNNLPGQLSGIECTQGSRF